MRRQGRFREAALEYTKVLALDPRHFKTYFNRGFTFDKVGVCSISSRKEVGEEAE